MADDLVWLTLADGQPGPTAEEPPNRSRSLLWFTAAVATVTALVLAGTALVSQTIAERDAIAEGVRMTNLLAAAVIEPRLDDAFLRGDREARRHLDQTVRAAVLPNGIVRVKVFAPGGTVLYSDEPRLIGRTLPLDPSEQAVLTHGVTRASIAPPAGAENEFERFAGELLEVRRPVTASSGQRLLLEVYGDYGVIGANAQRLWRTFLTLAAAGTLLLLLLLVPVIRALLRRLDAARGQAEGALRAALDASDSERRRLAGSLHDGPVQELAGSALIVSSAADAVRHSGQSELGDQVGSAAATIRRSLSSLRTLLIDLYPPRFHDADLAGAIADLAAPLRSRGVSVVLDISGANHLNLSDEVRRLVYRVAQECLRNAAVHSGADTVTVTLRGAIGQAHLSIEDDGCGFRPDLDRSSARPGHLGISIIADLGRQLGATLQVCSAPGRGTRWRLIVPMAGLA